MAPNNDGNGCPRKRTTGVDSNGDSVAIPMKIAPAPAPTIAAWLVVPARPAAISNAPRPVITTPATARSRNDRVGSTYVSRMAATGGTLAALRAGK